ncbi:unnamed protein product [Orchesella dallaii]|uniref:Uncharacterized protein n=1 Tax=Orchesella dallaii TaxID=48710 RepID=A0ABP1PW62_9HEXA
MKQASTQFKDRQVKPLENAMWWIEYVLRNPDVSALKPWGIYQPWYLRRSIDVWLLIVCITFIVFVSLLMVAVAILFKSRNHKIHLSPNFISEVEDYNYKGNQKRKKHD